MTDIYEKCLKNAQPVQRKMEENMFNIRMLDGKSKMIENEAKKKLTQLVNSWKKIGKEDKRRHYEAVEELFAKAKKLSDEKIRLAESTYEMVDGFIQKLDKETENFNTYAEHVQQQGSQMPSSSKAAEEQFGSRRRGTAPASSFSSTKSGGTGRKRVKDAVKSAEDDELKQDPTTLIMARGDMPVDPNEPRYCFCNQVSFGHMVGCDNKDCLLEWFHFDCVGLKGSPKGKWYCPNCREDKESTAKRQMKTPKSSRGKEEKHIDQ